MWFNLLYAVAYHQLGPDALCSQHVSQREGLRHGDIAMGRHELPGGKRTRRGTHVMASFSGETAP